jgi:hypothetical protein
LVETIIPVGVCVFFWFLFLPNTGTLQTNKWNTEYRNTTNKQMKCRIQEHYKQTDGIRLFVVFLYSVFHLFVCSAPVLGISSVCL